MNIQEMVVACFVKSNIEGLIICTISFYNINDELVGCSIADWSHQALIETLNDCWPTWTDADQNMARSENLTHRELAY